MMRFATLQSMSRCAFAGLALAALAGCATAPAGHIPATSGGGYYLDDGPPDAAGHDLAAIPDAVPRPEPLDRAANRPYRAMGHLWTPMTRLQPWHARGIASWYGRRYQGHPVADGERYDPFAMTAAHPTLPIPCYVRVTDLDNGRSVIVRVNDRGPFLRNRLIDLSYAAAWKLGFANKGSAPVAVDLIDPTTDAPDSAGSTAEETPAPAGNVTATAGVWLQLGVFASADHARSLRERAQTALAGQPEQVQIFADGDRQRVCVGPFTDRDQARAAMATIRQLTGVRPVFTAP